MHAIDRPSVRLLLRVMAATYLMLFSIAGQAVAEEAVSMPPVVTPEGGSWVAPKEFIKKKDASAALKKGEGQKTDVPPPPPVPTPAPPVPAPPAFSVRLAPLPNQNIVSIPAGPATKPMKANAPVAKDAKDAKSSKQPTKTEPSPAEAEIAERERKRLEALESDRQTLKSLHEAIKELGSSEQLDLQGATGLGTPVNKPQAPAVSKEQK